MQKLKKRGTNKEIERWSDSIRKQVPNKEEKSSKVIIIKIGYNKEKLNSTCKSKREGWREVSNEEKNRNQDGKTVKSRQQRHVPWLEILKQSENERRSRERERGFVKMENRE